jgi:predicted alpha/beta superfamily hydrolase
MATNRHMLRKASLRIAMVCAFCCSPALAEPAPTHSMPPPRLDARDIKSPSGSVYRITVTSPKGPAPPMGYPVIYVVDGNAWAPLVTAILNVNVAGASSTVLGPAVVVGVGYPIDGPFDLTRRVRDLTTPTEKHHDVIPARNGGYDDFIKLIEDVVKPDVERRYSIDRTRQTLLGHSLGGAFVLRTLLAHPASFQNYVALSPSIWWDDAALLRDVATIAPDAATVANTRVYLAAGELEQHSTPASHAATLKSFRAFADAHPEVRQGKGADALVAELEDHGRKTRMVDNARDMWIALTEKGYAVRFDSFPDEDHFSVVPSELGRALPFALKP